ncbi:hypothetical protein EWM64_g6307 [Hericium alpestre]|uniref:Uncharacterized protein n=1 Tax=Hericium alpestre TaxID=135208 RepID=A0A4Y9ZTY6_9AGAM|nr:hypothetical protein EWM64_g6307 [Hericium alpestre]
MWARCHSTSKGDESEMVAKEENIHEPMPEDGIDEDAGHGALPEPNEAGAPIDDYVQEADTPDLPEDLDMGAEDEADG